jgi:hypothetical protein
MTNKQDILNQIDRVDCQLSPENLHQDGEITRAQAQVKYNRLIKERNRLEKLLEEKVEYRG